MILLNGFSRLLLQPLSEDSSVTEPSGLLVTEENDVLETEGLCFLLDGIKSQKDGEHLGFNLATVSDNEIDFSDDAVFVGTDDGLPGGDGFLKGKV